MTTLPSLEDLLTPIFPEDTNSLPLVWIPAFCLDSTISEGEVILTTENDK